MINKLNNPKNNMNFCCPYTIQNIYYFSLSNYNIQTRGTYIFITFIFSPYFKNFITYFI